MKIIGKLLLFVSLLVPACLFAQEEEAEKTFSMSAQLRPRAEYRNGALNPRAEGQLPATFINNRARLSLDFKRDNLELRMSAQHVGVWGQEPQMERNGRFMLNEAWAKLKSDKGFFAQLGRQALAYDDERILGALDWNISGRYHDVLKLGYENDMNKLHLMFAFNQNEEKVIGGSYYLPIGQPYKNMQTAWYHYGNNSQQFNISLLVMNLGWEVGDAVTEKASNSFMQTLGTYMTYKPGNWDFNGSFYYQMGKNRWDTKVSAFMASVRAGYMLSDKWAFSLGSDYMSGDDPDNDKFNAFDPLYGTHHKFYGSMDYFYPGMFRNVGLWDNMAGIKFKPCAKVDMSLDYHYFLIAQHYKAASGGNISKGLGSELDFQINWSIMKDVKLMAGYSVMLGSESMDYIKGGNHKSWQDWGWISININPSLFFTKWK